MTIDELARLAGVSKTTVSRVLNRKPDVSKETSARINALIRDTGYTPNAFAKAINNKKSNTIGLVIPYGANYIFTSQYFSELLRGISSQIDERAYCLMLCYPKDSNCVEFFKQGRVDGFIVITPDLEHTDFIDDMLAVKAPFILTSALPKYHDVAPHIDIDEYAAAWMAVEHLIGLGHTRIAFIGEDISVSSKRRCIAYQECLTAHNIPFREEYVQLGYDELMEFGCTFTKKLMELPQPPTAIFCAADMIAIGANRALHMLNRQIPRDVSLVGFDDIFMCRYLNPPLTTIHQSAYNRGYIVSKILVDFLQHGTPMEYQSLDFHLEIRDSSAPPPSA